jgi:SAM-dependent methyltransferase
MKNNIKEEYTNFHIRKKSNHLYPTEWVIRTMLGSYPELKLDKSRYQGGKILDLGFGDGRNMKLLSNCGLKIHGVEITQETVDLCYKSLAMLQVEAELKVGSNTNIPFEAEYFDYILASSSCYYLDSDNTFNDNMQEIKRVLKKGGSFIANFPAFIVNDKIAPSFILENAERLNDGHVIVRNDIYGLRNGYKFKTFDSKQGLLDYFSNDFQNISIGLCIDNYYGVQINVFFITAQKK